MPLVPMIIMIVFFQFASLHVDAIVGVVCSSVFFYYKSLKKLDAIGLSGWLRRSYYHGCLSHSKLVAVIAQKQCNGIRAAESGQGATDRLLLGRFGAG